MERTESATGTADRVRANTAQPVNRRVDRRTEAHLRKVADAGPKAIAKRLAALDAEWDMERVLQANAAAAVLAGLYLGVRVNRKWLALPTVIAGFLMQHAVQGWCPPVALFRRIGVRTQQEINEEKIALRVLRGDFTPTPDPELALAQVRRQPATAESAGSPPLPGHVVVSPVDRSALASTDGNPTAVGEWAVRNWDGGGISAAAERSTDEVMANAVGSVTGTDLERTVRLRAPGRSLRGVLAPYYLPKART